MNRHDDLHKAIAMRMKELAEERNTTAAKIGVRGGITQSTISDIVLGKVRHPKVDTVMRFCDGADITIDKFFDSDLFRKIDVPKKNYRDYQRTIKEMEEDL